MHKITSLLSSYKNIPYFTQNKPISKPLKPLTNLLQKIWNVVKFILGAAVTFALYYTNPSLFAIGFIAGIIFDRQTKEAMQKIADVWHTQLWSTTILAGLACTLSMPITLATGSILVAAKLGANMSLEASQKTKAIPQHQE